jgi:DNA-binding transcriptional MerR regulator
MLTPLDIVFRPRWDATEPNELTRSQLIKEAGVSEKVVGAAEEMGFLFPTQRGRERRYTADDVHMLGVTKRWLDLGIPVQLGRLYRESLEEISKLQVRVFNDSVVAPVSREHLSDDKARERILDGYQSMASVFEELVGLLHRKVLQKAVESYAASDESEAG